MPVTVLLAASLRKYVPDYDAASGFEMPLPPGSPIRELARRLGIPEAEVKLIMADGIHADWDTVLMGDERVALFPPVGGG